MKSYNLSISYAKEKLEDYEVILMNYGYSELTIKEKKKKIKNISVALHHFFSFLPHHFGWCVYLGGENWMTKILEH